MTREEEKEAIKAIKEHCYFNNLVPEAKEALDKVIESLEQDSCYDCISRQAVIDLMRSLTRWCVRSEDGKFNNVGLLYDDVMFGIEQLSPVAPQTRKGHWIYKKIDERTGITNVYICSKCGYPLASPYKSFCSACGSDNRKVKE